MDLVEVILPRIACFFIFVGGLIISIRIHSWWYEMIMAHRLNLGMLIETVISAAEQNLPIADTLKVVAEDGKGFFRSRLRSAIKLIHEGIPLGEALRRQRGYFPASVCNMLGAGERYGNLKLFARYLRDMFTDTMAFRETTARYLSYPIFLSMALSSVFTVIVLVVVPQFKVMFEEIGMSLPPITAFVISYGVIVLPLLPMIVGATLLVVLFSGTFCTMLRRKLGVIAGVTDRVAVGIPCIGTIIERASYAQFAHSVGALLQCGMPLHEAVDASLDLDLNATVKRRLERVRTSLMEGESFGESLRIARVPEQLCWFANAGEGGAGLADNMIHAAEIYRSNVGTALKASSRVVVPLTIIPMGIVLGVVVVGVYSPLMALLENMI